jgi:hypothetical protein
LVGVDQTIILDGVKSQLSKERNWQNPFGHLAMEKQEVGL